ncbi:hypothetical protein D3C71_1753210 [compost metagenome]
MVPSAVALPRITSTSGIFSTGEKKCRPTNCAGRDDTPASPVIGSVDVFDAKIASGAIAASARWVASALTARSSNTASITIWQSASAA